MKNRKREICTSGSVRDEDGQPPHLLGRRQFLHLVVGAGALPGLSRIARAQAYPTRPVRIIVPLSRRPSILHHRTSHWSIAVGAARAEPSPFLQDLKFHRDSYSPALGQQAH